jgi:hypothetical protein
MFMRFLGIGIGHCSQHTARRAGNDADGSQMCIADDERNDDAENADNDEEDEEAEEVFDDEDEVTGSEGDDVETDDDDDIGYDAL